MNSFLTLTYDDDHVPTTGDLQPRDLTLFLKRLRKYADKRRSSVNRDRSSGIRFLACGEYGEQTQRAHYHALLFNCGFNDAYRVGKDLFSSETLRELWPYGDNKLGELTAASASYVAQYNLKKQYERTRWRTVIDYETGEILGTEEQAQCPDGVWRRAPFLRMSLKPAIGARWVDKYGDDLREGYLVTPEGRQTAIPRYYQKRLNDQQPLFMELLRANVAKHRMRNPSDNNQPERRAAAEVIHKRRKELTERRGL